MIFLSAFGLGFAFCASPGAVTAQALRRGFERGFLSALYLQLGALIGLALWAIIAIVGASMIVQNLLIQSTLGTVGALLLLQLAWQALRDAYRGIVAEAKSSNARGDFALGALLSLANPLPIAFWLSIGSNFISIGEPYFDPEGLSVFLAGFFSGGLVWSFLLSSLISWAKHSLTPLFFRLVNLICGLMLGFFALLLLWKTLSLIA